MATQHRLRQQTVGVAVALGRQLQKEIFATTIFVFVTIVLRSVFSTMCALKFQHSRQLLISIRTLLFTIYLMAPNRYATAYTLQDFGKKCPGKNECDSSCYNVCACLPLTRTPFIRIVLM
jgi:hypothetical protein